MICKICHHEIADVDGAVPFIVGGRTRFHTHPACQSAVRDAGVMVGQTVRQLIELRKPGWFQIPAVRSVLAALKELRK